MRQADAGFGTLPVMSNMTLFRAQHLVKRFGSTTVVDDLSFEIHVGECLGVIGPNGAGKTTTIRMCLGLAAAERWIGFHRFV